MNVAIGYKDGGVYVVNIVSGETLKTFQRREGTGGITTLAYVELCNGSVYLRYNFIVHYWGYQIYTDYIDYWTDMTPWLMYYGESDLMTKYH